LGLVATFISLKCTIVSVRKHFPSTFDRSTINEPHRQITGLRIAALEPADDAGKIRPIYPPVIVDPEGEVGDAMRANPETCGSIAPHLHVWGVHLLLPMGLGMVLLRGIHPFLIGSFGDSHDLVSLAHLNSSGFEVVLVLTLLVSCLERLGEPDQLLPVTKVAILVIAQNLQDLIHLVLVHDRMNQREEIRILSLHEISELLDEHIIRSKGAVFGHLIPVETGAVHQQVFTADRPVGFIHALNRGGGVQAKQGVAGRILAILGSKAQVLVAEARIDEVEEPTSRSPILSPWVEGVDHIGEPQLVQGSSDLTILLTLTTFDGATVVKLVQVRQQRLGPVLHIWVAAALAELLRHPVPNVHGVTFEELDEVCRNDEPILADEVGSVSSERLPLVPRHGIRAVS